MAEQDGHRNVRKEGDEYVCAYCKKRWGADERGADIPPCNDDRGRTVKARDGIPAAVRGSA
jgi:hypothetical protein